MGTWTKNELAENVLSYLGLKAQGQNVSAGDNALIGKNIESVVDGLRPTCAVYFDLSAIPDWALIPLTEMVAVKVGPHFGRQLSPGLWREARADFIGGGNTARPMSPAKGTYF